MSSSYRIARILLSASSRKQLLYLIVAFMIVVFTIIFVISCISTTSLSELLESKFHSDRYLPPTPCLSRLAVERSIRDRFNISGRTIFPDQSSLNPLQVDTSFSKKNMVKTLSQISSMLRVEEVNCLDIFNGSKLAIKRSISRARNIGFPICDQMYVDLTSDCKAFQAYRGYIMSPLTKKEENFPLAFSIMAYRDAEMVERLLRAIYRPQNYYCIHVDLKSSNDFFRAISYIANCFTNVIVASKRIDVKWGKFSVLEPDLLCMEELWRFPKWKYFTTLTGQEFPLKTNLEIVRILTAYNGANDIMTTLKGANVDRWKNTVPPHGITAVKGSDHITVNRDFVDYVLHNDIAKALLNWTKKTDVPDETFFATLNANPQLGIRGTYTGEPEMSEERPFITRYKNWTPEPCAGRYVRGICILTTGDLPSLFQAKQLFANKFFLNQDRVVIGCLEEKIFNDTRDGYIGLKTLNISYYSNLGFVKNQVFKNE